MKRHARDEGFSLLETMIAATIAGIAFVGTMTAVAVASRFIPQTGLVDTAQERVQSRLEGKQSVRWRSLLMDDLDHDGMPETIMKDDGQGADAVAGDGIYTGTTEQDGLTEVWTIEVDPMRPIATVGMATIRSVVTYHGTNGPQQVRMQTIRANPAFLGVPQL
jgi:type II secretory pathway pseudopilin PulG